MFPTYNFWCALFILPPENDRWFPLVHPFFLVYVPESIHIIFLIPKLTHVFVSSFSTSTRFNVSYPFISHIITPNLQSFNIHPGKDKNPVLGLFFSPLCITLTNNTQTYNHTRTYTQIERINLSLHEKTYPTDKLQTTKCRLDLWSSPLFSKNDLESSLLMFEKILSHY